MLENSLRWVPEVREEDIREGRDESDEVPRPTTVDAVAKVVAAISFGLIRYLLEFWEWVNCIVLYCSHTSR